MSGYREAMHGTTSPPPMCIGACTRVNERKKIKKGMEREADRERLPMFFVLIQGKLTLCVDRTSNHLLGFCCPPQGFGSGGFAPSSLLSHNSPTLDPLFSQLLSVNVRAPFLCQICTDSCGTASFWGAPDAFNLTRLADISSSGGPRGQEEVW